MIKTILYSILAVALFMWAAKTTISFSPFKIEFQKLWTAIGIIFLCAGVGMMQYQEYKEGIKEGTQQTLNKVNEVLKSYK